MRRGNHNRFAKKKLLIMTRDNPKAVELSFHLPKKTDGRGCLSFIESNNHIPFQIKSVNWLRITSESKFLDGRARRVTHELIVAISGHCRINIDDGSKKFIANLDGPHKAVHLPPKHWRSFEFCSPDATLLIIASDAYHESDYLRDYSLFLATLSA